MRRILTTILAIISFITITNAQIVERSVEAIETLQTGVSFIYRGVDIPVLDISYHEWSADSITWRKNYVEGDCYLRISNDVKDTWVGINVCGGSGSGTSQIDTIIVVTDGVSDTITSGTATVTIPTPTTITGTTGNTTDSTHTHEIVFYMGDVENVDTTGVVDGQVLKWNAVTEEWIVADDLLGGGSSTLRVKEQDGTPNVSPVYEIRIDNGHVTNEGAGVVSIDFSLDPIEAGQEFYRTDTLTVQAGDTFVTFDSALPSADYVVTSAYTQYPNGERQTLTHDSIAADGFRVLDVIGESVLHYTVIRNLDSLLLALDNQGYVMASATDVMGYLNSKTDDSTIIVTNNELTVLKSPYTDSVPEGNVYINSDSESTLTDYLAHVGTPHIDNGSTITDLGNDSIAIAAAGAYIKTSNSPSGEFMQIHVDADTLYVPRDTNFLVVIDYNSGAPYYRLVESQVGYLFSNWDELPFASIVNMGYRIIENSYEQESINPVYRILLSQINYQPVRFLGGLEITHQSSREFSVAAGAAVFANTTELISPINTSTVDTFTRVYYDNGWQRVVGETVVNNTHYNDTAQGLVALTPDYYTHKWLYYVKDAPSFWIVLDGQSQTASYSQESALSKPQFLPPELNGFYAGALLVGKFIVQEGRTEFIEIQNPFEPDYGQALPSTSKSYSFTTQGIGSGRFYIGGFYNYATADANLTNASLTQTFGTTNVAHASHPFVVAGGAGTVNSGVVGLRVTGTRIQDSGVRTATYADTIITDITSVSLNDYYEAEKFIGTVTYELIVMSGTPTVYSFDFNYGFAKYEDFGNSDFDVIGFETVGRAGASDAGFNITLIHHNSEDWTYAATGFLPTPTVIADLQTIYNTEYAIANDKPFAFKLAPVGYSEIIHGSLSEGVIVRVITTAPNSVQYMDTHIGVRISE